MGPDHGGVDRDGFMVRSLGFILNFPVTGWGDGARVCTVLPPRPQVLTCVILGKPNPCARALGAVVVFTRRDGGRADMSQHAGHCAVSPSPGFLGV